MVLVVFVLFSFLRFTYLFNVCESFACVYVCVPHVCLVPVEVKRCWIPELELWMVLGHYGCWKSGFSAKATKVLLVTDQSLQSLPLKILL